MEENAVLKAEIDKIIAEGVVKQSTWSDLLIRVWSDGQNTPEEADQMFRLLQAINEGKVKTIA